MDARDKILQAALQVFAEAGSRGATTRRIAEVAGVNEVTLFRHFQSKERLLREALLHSAQGALTLKLPQEPVAPEAELARWSEELMRHLYQRRQVIRTCIGEFEDNPELTSSACQTPLRVAEELNDYLLRLRERGWIDAVCDTRAAAALLMGALFSDATGRDIMPQRFPYPLEEAASKYVRLFVRAVGLEDRGTRFGTDRDEIGG